MKAARERNGITIAQIAASTKIATFHLSALERGDLRRWPKGLFRRSFFRDYARMIGVPVAETCVAFVRWFPDDEPAPPTTQPGAANAGVHADEIRLMLDGAWHGPRVSVMPRLLAAAIDIGTVTLVAIVWAWMAGRDPSATMAMVALAYFSLATVLFGGSPAKWAITGRRSFFETLARAVTAVTAASRRAPAEEPSEEPQILIHTTIP